MPGGQSVRHIGFSADLLYVGVDCLDRETAAKHTRGCIVLERPDLLEQLAQRHGARDTTARHAAVSELQKMDLRPSQYNPGQEVPEKSWAYRLAKYFFFNDYGTYGKHFDAKKWIDVRTEVPPPRPTAASRCP